MAAPVTKLLFLFLLGITSWSRYVAANEVILQGCTTEIADGNDVVESLNCEIEDNMLKSDVTVINDCPGVVELTIQVLKDNQVVNSAAKTIKQPLQELADLCASVEGPDPDDDSCSMAPGVITISKCDVESATRDMDPGTYKIIIAVEVGGNRIFELTLLVEVIDNS